MIIVIRYTMGSAEPRSFSRGKRGIAGTLVFTVFDHDALINALEQHVDMSSFQRIGGNANMQAMDITEWDKALTNMITNQTDSAQITNDIALSWDGKEDSNNVNILNSKNGAVNSDKADTKHTKIYYADEIPPFDITISFANEYGQNARVVIYSVEILNEGSGFSIDNVSSEKACTFVARRVDYMKAVVKGDTTTGGNTTNNNTGGSNNQKQTTNNSNKQAINGFDSNDVNNLTASLDSATIV